MQLTRFNPGHSRHLAAESGRARFQKGWALASCQGLNHQCDTPGDGLGYFCHYFLTLLFFSFFRRSCQSAWSQLRLTPIFGCICPSALMSDSCDLIFKTVNGNPCIGETDATFARAVLTRYVTIRQMQFPFIPFERSRRHSKLSKN